TVSLGRTVITTSFRGAAGWLSLEACGTRASSPVDLWGMIMKMMSKTSKISIIGVTLISARREPEDIAMCDLLHIGQPRCGGSSHLGERSPTRVTVEVRQLAPRRRPAFASGPKRTTPEFR